MARQTIALNPENITRQIKQTHAVRFVVTTGFALGCFTVPALAQDRPILEEIMVTAQKRVETLQDVPISVSAVTGDKLEKASVENLEDLTAHMPNIHFTETGISTQVRVRGIGSDNSQGFEQSVGMYIDGIYYGRAQLFRLPMMDMERAELLRGPQGTLFGKNSIAGALNLTTARPSDELEGKLGFSRSDAFSEQEINAVISGPLAEQFRARLAYRAFEDDGFMYNRFTRSLGPIADEDSVRLSLDWTPTDSLSFFVKAQHDTFDTLGRPIEITQDTPLASGSLTYNETLSVLGQPGFETEQDYIRDVDLDEFSNNRVNNFVLQADYEFENMKLTMVTGALGYTYTEKCDCDFVAAEILDIDIYENYDQISQEIRFTSDTEGTIEWIGGVYYQEYDQEFDDRTHLYDTNLIPYLPLDPPLTVMANTGVWRDFEQSSESWAVFGQATWHINSLWHLTFGARYTQETKDASKAINITDADVTTPITEQPLATILGETYKGIFTLESEQSLGGGHNVTGKRDESAFTPMLNLQFDATDEMLLYASFTTGFKAGGFDPRSNQVGVFGDVPLGDVNPLLHFEFEEEKATAFELGMKTSFADGQGELNLALYHTNYTDLQISQYDGGVGFNVGNAKDTLVQGIEIDGRWALFDNWTLSYGAAWLDFEYKDFKNGNCYSGQVPDGVDLDSNGSIDTCDYTGKEGVYTPELTLNASLNFSYSISDYLSLVGFFDVQHIGEQQVHVNQDPRGETEAYAMLGARLGVEAKHWSLAVVGKNLLDEQVISYSGNASLSDLNFEAGAPQQATFYSNTFYSFLRKPRTVALEAVIHF